MEATKRISAACPVWDTKKPHIIDEANYRHLWVKYLIDESGRNWLKHRNFDGVWRPELSIVQAAVKAWSETEEQGACSRISRQSGLARSIWQFSVGAGVVRAQCIVAACSRVVVSHDSFWLWPSTFRATYVIT
ncbi:amino-acid acetyltransferase [Striga asiatica]|uniref:Amino-acid acetyltransferase n=1 Tax=Striga asiatica TaxID=4170 RepID=A0A5A7PGN3_STRAF|nr:amino-acid acetyltransferase [Striga asiatica]